MTQPQINENYHCKEIRINSKKWKQQKSSGLSKTGKKKKHGNIGILTIIGIAEKKM